jgi:hypothetical protein
VKARSKLKATAGLALLFLISAPLRATTAETVVVHPAPYEQPLRNPLMGFIGPADGRHPYATLAREYVKWNSIENSVSDGVEKLKAHTEARWKTVGQRNIKIIPRVFLEWPRGSGVNEYWPIDSYWPADMPRDFGSAQFKERVVRMIHKMGVVWDDDPRIAFIEMGMIGPWGEQHHPSPDLETQKLMGDAFKASFKHKLVMNRYPWEFKDYDFGIHWDSFGNPGWEMSRHVPELEGRLGERWKLAPMAGEMSFSKDPNVSVPRLAMTPTEAVAAHSATLIRYIRRWHWTALGWVGNYDGKNPAALRGAAAIQSAFGYRFVIDEVCYPARVEPGGELNLKIFVRNLGSAPIYYNWPIELSLLDGTSRQPAWQGTFQNVDVRKWLPGEFSDKGKGRPVGDKKHAAFEWDTGIEYDIPAATNTIRGSFRLPGDLPAGSYIVALAMLDPAGNLPAVKFAIKNYFKGGRHPIGWIQVGAQTVGRETKSISFDEPSADASLHYIGSKE